MLLNISKYIFLRNRIYFIYHYFLQDVQESKEREPLRIPPKINDNRCPKPKTNYIYINVLYIYFIKLLFIRLTS